MTEELVVNKRHRVGDVGVDVVQQNDHHLLKSQIIERVVVNDPVFDIYKSGYEVRSIRNDPDDGRVFAETVVHDGDWGEHRCGLMDLVSIVSRKSIEGCDWDWELKQKGSGKGLDIHELPNRLCSKSKQIDQAFVLSNLVASFIYKPRCIYCFKLSGCVTGLCFTWTSCVYIDESNTFTPTDLCAIKEGLVRGTTISVGDLAYLINTMQLMDDPSGKVLYRVKSPCAGDDSELYIQQVLRIR